MRVSTSVPIGALDPADVVAGNTTGASTDPYRIISVQFTYGVSDLASVSDDGHEFGLAHSDYSDAEIEECLEASGSVNAGDLVTQEQADRKVRIIGQMVGAGASGSGLSFNHGMPVKTRLNWAMTIGDLLKIWIRNASGVVWTTGASLDAQGVMWVKDAV